MSPDARQLVRWLVVAAVMFAAGYLAAVVGAWDAAFFGGSP